MMKKTSLIVLLIGLLALPAAAGQHALSRSTGDLYRLQLEEDGLTLRHRAASGEIESSVIPTTEGIDARALNVALHDQTGSVFVLWEQVEGASHRIRFAARVDGEWVGPISLAGTDGSLAVHPQMVVHRVSDAIEIPPEEPEGEPTTETLVTDFVHMVWWSRLDLEDPGTAMAVSLPIEDDGMPDFGAFAPAALSDLLPYGIGCFGLDETAEGLTYPHLFFDPDSGNPHVLTTDFAECLLQIIRAHYEILEDEDPLTGLKRRRHITVWRSERTMGVSPDLPLDTASTRVGHDLSIVLYWDDSDEAISYMHMTEDSATEIRTLPLDGLTHEQAVDLIGTLVR